MLLHGYGQSVIMGSMANNNPPQNPMNFFLIVSMIAAEVCLDVMADYFYQTGTMEARDAARKAFAMWTEISESCRVEGIQ